MHDPDVTDTQLGQQDKVVESQYEAHDGQHAILWDTPLNPEKTLERERFGSKSCGRIKV